MQISMPPARPPAGTRDRDPEPTTPRPGRPARRPWRPSPAPDFIPRLWCRGGTAASPAPPTLSWLAPRGDEPGDSPRAGWGPGLRPPARPGSGAGPRRPGPTRKRGGTNRGGRPGVRVPKGPTCQDRLPRVRQLGFSGRGRGGRQSARRGHRSRGGGAPDVGLGSEPPAFRARSAAAAAAAGYGPGGGAVASAPGLRPAWSEPGPALGPPHAGWETEAGAGRARQAQGRGRKPSQ